jgi:hypothetical protein
MSVRTDDWYRDTAEAMYIGDDNVIFDAGAAVSRGDGAGAFVAAWVWVADEQPGQGDT